MATTSGSPSSQPPPTMNLPGGVNPLDFLYKLAIQRGMTAPEFKQVTEQGPAHMKTFVWHCSFNGMVAQGTGRSKKEAKVSAAKAIRDTIDYDKLPVGPNNDQSGNDKKRRSRESKDARFAPWRGPLDKRKRMGCFYGPPFSPLPRCGPVPYGRPPGPFVGPSSGMMMMGPPPPPPPPPPAPNSWTSFPPPAPSGEAEEGKKEEGKANDDDGEEVAASSSAGPTREEFMHPYFGGFFNDDGAAAAPLFDIDDGSDATCRSNFDRERSFMVAEYQSRMAAGYRSRLSKLDRVVIRKHREIFPPHDQLASILKLVSRTEEGLKRVAETLNGQEDEVKISGMARVGDLSKGLLLASVDRTVDLVLLCKAPPTRRLLGDVVALLKEKMKEVDEEDEYVVCVDEDSSSLMVGRANADCRAKVTLTSVSLTTDVASGGEDEESKLLPRENCLRALTELRHSKWFSVTAANLPSCVECIRVVKDLARRDHVWNLLSGWAIELLVERSLFSAWIPLNPAASLMRVMEVVSSGIFLKDDDKGLADPCETSAIDVTANLSPQEKEDLTRSAQTYLRFMHFRKIHKVLGMSGDDDDGFDERPADFLSKEVEEGSSFHDDAGGGGGDCHQNGSEAVVP